jgi:hypothetical protein
MNQPMFRFTALEVLPLQKGDLHSGVPWEDSGLWRVQKFYCSDMDLPDGKVLRVTLQEGFVFNMRSGPALVDVAIPKSGPFSVAWANHDGCYWEGSAISRKLADWAMWVQLRTLGLSPARAKASWAVVRAFGHRGYTPNTHQARRGLVQVRILEKAHADYASPDMIGVPWHKELPCRL